MSGSNASARARVDAFLHSSGRFDGIFWRFPSIPTSASNCLTWLSVQTLHTLLTIGVEGKATFSATVKGAWDSSVEGTSCPPTL